MKNEILRQIDELGRVVIPTKLLSRYGLKAGDVVAFSAYENGILISKGAFSHNDNARAQ